MDVILLVSANIKHYRNKLGISQEELADRSSLHRTYISSVELGKRNISIKNLEKISEALEIPIYKLLLHEGINV